MNDGAADPAGRFWAGSMAYDGAPGRVRCTAPTSTAPWYASSTA
jgi:sugar lactone lactonase YvrE